MGRVFDSLTNAIQGSLSGNAQNAQVAQIELAGSRDRRDHAYRVEQDKIQNDRLSESLRMQKETHTRNGEEYDLQVGERNKAFAMDLADRLDMAKTDEERDAIFAASINGNNHLARFLLPDVRRMHPEGKDAGFVKLPNGNFAIGIDKDDGSNVPVTDNRSNDPDDKITEFSPRELREMSQSVLGTVRAINKLNPVIASELQRMAIDVDARNLPQISGAFTNVSDTLKNEGPEAAVAKAQQLLSAQTPRQGLANSLAIGKLSDGFIGGVEQPTTESRLAPPGFMGGLRMGASGVVNPSITGIDYSKGATNAEVLGTVAGTIPGTVAGMVGDAGQLIGAGISKIADWGGSEAIHPTAKTKTSEPKPTEPKPTDMAGKGVIRITDEEVAASPSKALQKLVDNADSKEQDAQGRRSETNAARKGPQALSPSDRASMAARLMHRKVINFEQAARFVETGYLDSQTMQMSNYPKEMQAKLLEAESRMIESQIKLQESQNEKFAKDRKATYDHINAVFKTFNSKDNPLPSSFTNSFISSLKFLNVATRFDSASGQPVFDPAKTLDFLQQTGAVESAIPIFRKLTNEGMDGTSAGTMALMSAMRGTAQMGEYGSSQLNAIRTMDSNDRNLEHHVAAWKVLTDDGKKRYPPEKIVEAGHIYRDEYNRTLNHLAAKNNGVVSPEMTRKAHDLLSQALPKLLESKK